MGLENQLSGWTGPSSDTEQDKQERTERMIRQAIDAHTPFKDCSLKVYAKGSYANNTNIRADSDVDIAVECTEAEYWEEAKPGFHKPRGRYEGIWNPEKLRSELVTALKAKFTGQVDDTGSTAIQINSGSARVDADVVPCFSYGYYFEYSSRQGTKIFKTDGGSLVNYPAQQLENVMAEDGTFRDLPSFFIESLAFNCPDSTFTHSAWTDCMRAILVHIWQQLQGDEPTNGRWVEANDCLYLFPPGKKWSREDGREFAKAAWNYFGFK